MAAEQHRRFVQAEAFHHPWMFSHPIPGAGLDPSQRANKHTHPSVLEEGKKILEENQVC